MTKETYGEAYTQGYVRTVRYLCSRGISAQFSQELAQSAWVRGWERIQQLRNDSMVLTWVNTIALNTYRNGLRNAPQMEPLKEYSCIAEDHLASIDIQRILTRCAPQQRKLFERYLDGATVQEIAEDEQASMTAIRLRLLRARRDVFRTLTRSDRRSAEVAL